MDDLRLASLRQRYHDGRLDPTVLVEALLEKIAAEAHECNAWITVLSRAELEPYLTRLRKRDPAELPLYGIPFAVKDNIDLAGVPTTAGCPAYAYVPQESAFVVQRLIDAGAVPLGKTHLDQFATGLVGTRSPYGVCRNVVDPAYVAGGSSSGSAVAVARGHVAFALGTDTAGSGRVPAAFNGLVGLKPTRGHLSTAGVVPACASLDCVSLLTCTAGDALTVLEVAGGFDEADPFARPAGAWRGPLPKCFRFGIPRPEQLEFFGRSEYPPLFERAVARLRDLGGEPSAVDFTPFAEAASLLYRGPWVAERYAALEGFLDAHGGDVHPVTRTIIAAGAGPTAAEAFRAQHRLAALRRQAEAALAHVDVMVTPTAPFHPTVAEVEAEPLEINHRLGHYTNFMNLLDLAACALPMGRTNDGRPFGITLFADRWADRALLELAGRCLGEAITVKGDYVPLVVCGAHMSGLPLNHQLTDRGGRLCGRTRTAPRYRLHALAGGPPHRPGLLRTDEAGAAVEVEVWELPVAELGGFVELVPAPLCIGRVELQNGERLPGFLCEPAGLDGARDITALGGWRAYLKEVAS